MIELTRINLLPYREEIKQRKKEQFKLLMLAALLTGLGLSVAAYLTIESAISNQQGRNTFLENAIQNLDKDLGEIKKLQEEKANFLAKKQKVEELQEKRSQAAQIIDTLNVLAPDNTYLTELAADNPNSYKVTGRASSDNKIAMFMRALPSTGVFTQPELLSIKKIENYQEFTLGMLLAPKVAPNVPSETAASAASNAASSAPAQEMK